MDRRNEGRPELTAACAWTGRTCTQVTAGQTGWRGPRDCANPSVRILEAGWFCCHFIKRTQQRQNEGT